MIFSFAGCIMEGAPFLTPFQPGGQTSTRGMSTEGVLRLLAGETLSLDEQQAAKVREQHPDWDGTYHGITGKIDAILWTPVSDAIFLTPMARCPDKTTYPFYDGTIDTILGSTGASLSVETIRALWSRLYSQTIPPVSGNQFRFRAVVYYPTDHLASSAWKTRIDTLQQLAKERFSAWHHYTIEPELAEPGGFWAHYAQEAKKRLWKRIEQDMMTR